MNFVNPLAFWALSTIIIVVLLYFFKLKRKENVVPALFLFDKVALSQKTNKPLQKLRKNLLLFVQIIFLLTSIIGLARPTFVKDLFSSFSYAIIIDTSASMKATDAGGKSRFARAQEKAIEIVNDFAESDTAALISADSETRLRAPFTSDKRTLINAINLLEPSEAPTNIYAALNMATAMLNKSKIDKIFVISDGAGATHQPALETDETKKNIAPDVDFVRVGTSNDNVGIIDFDVNLADDKSGVFQVFARLVNFSNETKKGDLELYSADTLVDVKEADIPPKGNSSIFFDNLRLKEGLVHLKLAVKDSFAVDNDAYFYVGNSEKIKVLLVTNGNLFMQNALSVNPLVELVAIPSADYNEGNDYSIYDVVIFDGIPVKNAPNTNVMLINAPCDSLGIRVSESHAIENFPQIISYDKAHPIMRFLNIDNTVIAESKIFLAPTWLQKIVESEHSALIFAGENNKRRIMLITFNLKESDLALKSSFPILIHNSTLWLSNRFDNKALSFYKTGDSVKMKLYEDNLVEVMAPESHAIEVKTTNDELSFDDTKWAGLYRIKGENGYENFFIANLLNENESDILPADSISVGKNDIKSTDKVAVRKELWKLFVIIAIALLSLEWWVYHRQVS